MDIEIQPSHMSLTIPHNSKETTYHMSLQNAFPIFDRRSN